MNKFRANLHAALFETQRENLGTPERSETDQVLDNLRREETILAENVRRNNDALASSIVETKEEKQQTDEQISKQLEKQLKQLAKNKKIDLSWTDNSWKCSRAEKRLATSSVKVFQELLAGNPGKLAQMIEKCKSKNGELTDQEAEERKKQLFINSKTKDIQRFYEAFKEYQDPQSQFQHLKNLMGFFCESDFENKRDLREALEARSEKISKQDISEARKMLYKEGNRKPKDWKQRASFEVIKNRLQSKETSITNKMLTLLGDFNLDGEVNSGDIGYKTGSQLVDVFRRTVATKHLEDAKFDDNVAVKNIVAYANKFGMDIQNVQTVDGLYKWMTDDNGYENTRKFQDFLRNLPVELGDVISNGAAAGKDSLDKMVSAINLEEKEKEDAKHAAAEKSKEIVSAGETQLKEVIKDDRERADITQQLLDQLPSMLISKATEQQRGLAVGTAVPLDQIIKGMSGGFNVGIGPDGKPSFGLFLGWDRKFNLSDRTQLETAITGGAKLLFIPCAAASMEISRDTNKGRRNKDLDVTGEHRISLGGNVAITGGIFSYGFSAGIESNTQVGIEKQAQNINKAVKKQAKSWIESLKGATDKKSSLKEALKTEFPKTSEEELNAATDNLLSIIQQFKIDEQSTESDFDVYAQVIADVYAEQWRNAAVAGIANNKRKISGGKVGIQFIAGCVPIVTMVAKFTKYRNARTNESEHSRTTRIDAQVNGIGNEQLSLGNSKEIGEDKVAQINNILERYGATSGLKYVAGVDGKPGKIQVPSSISDGVGINIRVSESLKGYVKKEINGIYSFPANATYRLLQETGGNQRSITLNIGSDKSSISDVMISDGQKMEEFLGDKELMGAKKLEYQDPRNELIEYRPDIDSLFTTDVVEGLKTIDSSNRRKFSEFMRTKRDALDNFSEMVIALKNVLGKNKKYEAILKQLDDESVSDEDKQLIIDRIMAISAYTNVHDKNGLDQNVRHRGDYYRREAMKGPNGKSIFDKLDVKRDDILSDIQDYSPVFKPNLLGATAFYNKNNTTKGLALTGLGATNVLGGKTKVLTGDDKKAAEEWFLGVDDNLGNCVPGALSEKSPKEWSNLAKVIGDKLPKGAVLGYWALKHLLKGEEVELSLDNSQKKVKVKLDVKYVFYLMGECANESVGIELGNLQVQEQHEVDDYSQGSLYLNNGEGTSVVNVSRRDVALGVSVGGGERDGESEEENSSIKTEGEQESHKGVDTNPQTDGTNNDKNSGDTTAGDGDTSTSHGGRPGQR